MRKPLFIITIVTLILIGLALVLGSLAVRPPGDVTTMRLAGAANDPVGEALAGEALPKRIHPNRRKRPTDDG
jgi:hypothetical protein